ncbi:MAG TPA: hypothetical protein VFL91_00275 [Thermomicrobiales bacterium]|nr:hypothetical protein [Thermomicrobiales bacterium]
MRRAARHSADGVALICGDDDGRVRAPGTAPRAAPRREHGREAGRQAGREGR